MRRLSIILSAFIILSLSVNAQTRIDSATNGQGIITKDVNKLKTGQANDVLTNFYQLAIKNIFGAKKELSFSSTIFGLLDSITRGKYENDAYYAKTRWARNIELTISGRVDSNSSVSSYGGGIKFYLINARDVTKKDDHLNTVMISYEQKLLDTLVTALKKFNNSPRRAAIHASVSKYGEHFDPTVLDPELIDTLKSMHSDIVYGKGLATQINNYFTEQVNLIKKKPLWSLGGSYLHSISNKIDTLTIQSDFLWGLGKDPHKYWELSASSYLQVLDNPVPSSGSIKKFHIEGGFNKILSETNDGRSNMELKAFASFDKGFNTSLLPATTKANLTYRYLVSQLGGFWIPITLSYDPSKGKLLGFIDLTFNIDPKK